MNTIDGATALYGIVGHPVAHSLSPAMHNAGFAALSINAAYFPLPAEKLDRKLLESLGRAGFKGLSVTIPHKNQACRLARGRDKLSSISGAANTLLFAKGGLEAFNTDGPGALKALVDTSGDLRGRNVLLLGYGGSAAGLAHALLLEKIIARLFISGRNLTRARKLAKQLTEVHGDARTVILAEALHGIAPDEIDIIINTTPLGMQGHSQELPLPEIFLLKKHIVFDIVYRPLRTPLLLAAGRAGARTIPGYTMLLNQALLQFELFTGQKAPVAHMEKALLRALKND